MENKKNDNLNKELNKLKIVKNLHVSESVLGISGTIILSTYQPSNEISYLFAVPLGVLCGAIFYHGIASQHKDMEEIDEINYKILLKNLEN